MKPIILYDSRFLDGVPAATDTADGYDVLHIRDFRNYTFWKAASAGTKYITVDCTEAKYADTLAIFSHNFKTASASVSVESSSNGSDWTERLAGFVPASDKVIFKLFTSVSARYWRVKIITAAIAPQTAVIMLGQRLTFERYIHGDFDPAPESIEAESSIGKTGHLLGSVIKNIQIEIDANWRNLSDTWIRNTFKPAWDAHISKLYPFFFAWDYDRYAADVCYVVLQDKQLSMPYNPIRRNLKLNMTGVKEE